MDSGSGLLRADDCLVKSVAGFLSQLWHPTARTPAGARALLMSSDLKPKYSKRQLMLPPKGGR